MAMSTASDLNHEAQHELAALRPPCPMLAGIVDHLAFPLTRLTLVSTTVSRTVCFEYRWPQFFEKLSVDPRFVRGTHELYDDALCPRCTILCSIRAAQNFTDTLADRVEIQFRIFACHRSFSCSFCGYKTGPLQTIMAVV